VGQVGWPRQVRLPESSLIPSSAACTTHTSARRKPDGLLAPYS
jgi:hypothetical protein